jgi:hypothetical protein
LIISIFQFFVRYTQDIATSNSDDGITNDDTWDEETSVWTLVQWGIPEGPEITNDGLEIREVLLSEGSLA